MEVVEAVCDIDEAIDDDLGVGATIGGIDAVAGFEVAERLEGGVVVAEGFDEDGFEFSCFCGGEEGCADPAVIGAEAAAGGFCGGVENTHVVGGGELGDEALVFLDGEAGVAHVCGVDEEFEVIAAEFFVDGFDEGPGALDVGECFEFAGAEEFDVPSGDFRIEQAGFFGGADVEFYVLCDGGVEIHVHGAVHPFLDGGGGYGGGAVGLCGAERAHELGDDRVFVGGVHRVSAADHHDEVGIEFEGSESLHHFRDVRVVGAWEKRDLHAGRSDGREGTDAIHFRDDGDAAVFFALEVAIGIRDEGVDESEVSGDDAEGDVGFEGE